MTYFAEQKTIIDCFIAVGPIFISAAIGGIAWSQLKTNKLKLRLDLYNRRFGIYLKTIDYYHACYGNDVDKITSCSLDFTKAYRESLFLFGRDSEAYVILSRIQQTLARHSAITKEEQKPNPDRELILEFRKQTPPHEIEKELLDLEHAIMPWLDFHNING